MVTSFRGLGHTTGRDMSSNSPHFLEGGEGEGAVGVPQGT